MNNLTLVSLTGADDQTNIEVLQKLGTKYSFVEWGLLYSPHNEGTPRNPSKAWREAFFDADVPGSTAVHLCGRLAFEQLLEGKLPSDVLRAKRLQLNINARKQDFTDELTREVFRVALALGPRVILQYHAGSSRLIDEFLGKLSPAQAANVDVLLDESRGLGIFPSTWAVPESVKDFSVGFAGGLGPQNVNEVATKVSAVNSHWLDMESGIRTFNRLDEEKAEQVLALCQPFASR
ncbi:hypothetical protein LC612_29355 [Nostoc sp. CHAB 5834]|nr:hypothetical protein [Nostoc sp. CHAB 5834]